MCMNVRRFCQCGQNSAFLLCRDNLLPPEILVNLYCPECSGAVIRDGSTMVEDCGWVVEYDVDRAQNFFRLRGLKGPVTAELIFDEGYLSWQGLSPGDQDVNTALHQRLAPLIEQDLALYLQTLKAEWLDHVKALKAAGWRKAQKT